MPYSLNKSIGGRKKKNQNKPKRGKTQKKQKGNLVAYGKIYADWCGYCKIMQPEWLKVERALLPLKPVNIESEKKDILVDQFNRKYKTDLDKNVGFPTIFKLSKYGGKIETYDSNDRSHESILAWLHDKKKVEEEPVKKPDTIFKWF